MSRLMSIWPTIERLITAQGAAALVTLAEALGSSPREAGARMVVAPDGTFTGTIGGGALEWGALAEAQALLARRDAPGLMRLDKALGPDLGQCCGGRVLLTIERFGAVDRAAVAALAEAERGGPLTTVATYGPDGRLVRRLARENEARAPGPAYDVQSDGRIVERFGEEATPFYLFGAGHVGRALSVALAPLPFAVTWVDARPGAFPGSVSANVTCVADDPLGMLARAPDGAFVAVMTHSHALDLDLVIAALGANRFPYVGLIGSATKRARFTAAMRKAGMAEAAVDSLVCPIGLTAISDKAPAAIAAAIAAQVLIRREAVNATLSVNPPLKGEGRTAAGGSGRGQRADELTPTRRASRTDLPLPGGGLGGARHG
jgi:xanthine dehydrogenase accessory factor